MFRFTIRELVLLTVIVGVGLGWWADRQRLLRSEAAKSRVAWTMAGYITKHAGRHVNWSDEQVTIGGTAFVVGPRGPLTIFHPNSPPESKTDRLRQ